MKLKLWKRCAAALVSVTMLTSTVAVLPEKTLPDASLTTYAEAMTLPSEAYEYEENDDGTVTITGYTYSNEEIIIPAEIDGKSVTKIGNCAFANCYYLTSVIIPENVVSIGWSAFAVCTHLASVTILNPNCKIYELDDCTGDTISNDYDYITGIYYYTGTISGYVNSTAHIYAKNHFCTFIPLETAIEGPTVQSASGDVNDDGSFHITDVVLLQKWLLAVPDTTLANWKAGDFYEDGVLNAFDLCMMKQMLKKKLA